MHAAGDPEARVNLIVGAGTEGVALVLRVGKVAGESGGRGVGVGAEEEASGDWVPGVADGVGIAGEARETMPIRDGQLAFRAVDDGFTEGDGKADGGAVDLVVIGVVVDVAAEVIDVHLEVLAEDGAETALVVIAFRGLDGQAEEIRGVDGLNLGGAGKQKVFKRRRLEDAVVGEVEDGVQARNVAGDGEARLKLPVVEDELVVVVAQTGGDGPVMKMYQVLNVGGLFKIGARILEDEGRVVVA